VNKTILDEMLVATDESTSLNGVVVGLLVELATTGEPLVDFPGNPAGKPVPAMATTRLTANNVGGEVALLFENGDASRPLIVGPLLHPVAIAPEPTEADGAKTGTEATEVMVDGQRVSFTAQEELVLRCGAASITLTRAGKILIRGKYVLSRSSGVNRGKGASIQLN